MAKIDKMLEMMSARGVERALLLSDQPIQLFSSNRKVDGPHLTTAQLQEALSEIVPTSLLSTFQGGGAFAFTHSSSHGAFDVKVENFAGALQATIAPVEQEKNATDVIGSRSSIAPASTSAWNTSPNLEKPAPPPPSSPAPLVPTSPQSQAATPQPQDVSGFPSPPTAPPTIPSSNQGPYPQQNPYPQQPPPYPQQGHYPQQPNSYPPQPYPPQPYAQQPAPYYPPQPYGYGPQPLPASSRSKIVGGLLGIFLGALGVHRFYLGYTSAGIAYLIITLVLSWFTCGISAAIASLIGFIEGVVILCGGMKDAEGRELTS